MKRFQLKNRRTKTFLLGVFLFVCSFSFSQENPWEVKKKENPWKTETKEAEKVATEKPKVETTDTLIAAQTEIDTLVNNVVVDTTVNQEKTTVKVEPKTETDPSTLVPAEKKEAVRVSLYEIEGKAKDEYNAGIALGLSIPCILFPPITFPILIASVFVPTGQQKQMIEQYKIDNPEATETEVKAVKRGIRKKRASRTAGGVGIGLGALLAVFGIAVATL